MGVRSEVRPGQWANAARALRVGALLQGVCVLLPPLDLAVLHTVRDHVAGAYPGWSAARIAGDRNAIIGSLVVVALLGVLGWLGAMWAVRRDRGVRATVTTLFLLGGCVLATVAGLSGGAYDQVVPSWLGLAFLVLPLLPGLAALVAAWQGQPR